MSESEKLANKLRTTAPFPVFLGGSRRMNELHPSEGVFVHASTDYDLYATYSEAAVKFIDQHDFLLTAQSSSGTGYFDTEIVEIYEHDTLNIQFLLRKDAEFYRKVFEAIPIAFYMKYLWKSSVSAPNRDAIMATFNAFFAVAHATEGAVSNTAPPSPPVIRDPIKAYEYAMKGIK